MSRIPRRQYTDDFKGQAVALAEPIGPAKAARQLDVSARTLANWLAASRAGKPVSELEAELARLRAENARFKMEREIEKNAAFFAKESKSGTHSSRANGLSFHWRCCVGCSTSPIRASTPTSGGRRGPPDNYARTLMAARDINPLLGVRSMGRQVRQHLLPSSASWRRPSLARGTGHRL